jgi:hypothetical protein
VGRDKGPRRNCMLTWGPWLPCFLRGLAQREKPRLSERTSSRGETETEVRQPMLQPTHASSLPSKAPRSQCITEVETLVSVPQLATKRRC